MQIEAENCQGLSAATDAIGVCLVPEYQSTLPLPQTTKLLVPAGSTSTNLAVIIPVIVAVVLILVVLVIIQQKR